METAKRNEEQAGTKMNDPAEGKRADARNEATPTGIPERPGTKSAPPAEGGDDVSGAGEPARGRR